MTSSQKVIKTSRKSECLPRAIPILRLWQPKSHHNFESSIDGLFLRSALMKIEPKILSDAVRWTGLSAIEVKNLEGAFGKKLRRKCRVQLADGLFLYLAGMIFVDKSTPWKELSVDLERMVEGLEMISKSTEPEFCQQSGDRKVQQKRHYLTSKEIMREFISSCGINMLNLNELLHESKDQLQHVRRNASKRGERGNASFRVLMISIILVAKSENVSLEIGSHMHKDEISSEYTPVFRAARCLLQIARSRALDTYSRSNLSDEEFMVAIEKVENQTQKSDRALQDQLEVALKSLERSRLI